MDPFQIIKIYYPEGSNIYNMLVAHSSQVAQKAVSIAQLHPELNANERFLWEASMLHDIGIFLTYAPDIHCFGTYPYLSHGFLGHDLLLTHNLQPHALVCERHTGTGLSLDTIISQNLPLPHRDMQPQSIEEQIICFSDCFFSKTNPNKEKSLSEVKHNISKWGEENLNTFNSWCNRFM